MKDNSTYETTEFTARQSRNHNTFTAVAINDEKVKWCQAGTQGFSCRIGAYVFMVGVRVYFCHNICKAIDSIQEIADFFFADYKPSSDDWFIPADSAALTPEPRLGKLSCQKSFRSRAQRLAISGIFLTNISAISVSSVVDFFALSGEVNGGKK